MTYYHDPHAFPELLSSKSQLLIFCKSFSQTDIQDCSPVYPKNMEFNTFADLLINGIVQSNAGFSKQPAHGEYLALVMVNVGLGA